MMNKTPQETLDELLEGYAEWQAFPCNKRGNTKEADIERVRFEKNISDARVALVLSSLKFKQQS